MTSSPNYMFRSLSILLPVLTVIPLLLLGTDAYWEVHDFLDSDVVWYKVLAESGEALSFSNSAVVEQYMNGLPRNSLPPALNVNTWLFLLFSPHTAMLINLLLGVLVAWLGMYFFARDILFPEAEQSDLRFGMAMTYSLTPFLWYHTGLAVAGLPLVAWALTQLSQGKGTKTHLLLLAGFAFYSSLLYTGLFFLIPAGILLVIKTISDRKIPGMYFAGLMVISAGYVISELNLFNQFLFSGMESHRAEFVFEGSGTGIALHNALNLLLFGHYHVPSLQFPVMIISCALTACVVLIHRKHLIGMHGFVRWGIVIGACIVAFALLSGFWKHQAIIAMREKSSLLQMIQWDRFHWLYPFLWQALFGLSLVILVRLRLFRSYTVSVVMIVMFAQAFVAVRRNEAFNINMRRLGTAPAPGAISMKSFYAEELFGEIKKYIAADPSTFRVISVGMYPDVAAWNGFYTLDSYQRNYPLAYKHQFGAMIRRELDKSEGNTAYFDHWGSRCYAFSAEMGTRMSFKANEEKTIRQFDLNVDAFVKMGGRYILAGLPVESFNDPRVVLRNIFSHSHSYWKVYLYEVLPEEAVILKAQQEQVGQTCQGG
jgi:hypothetical protein